MKMFGHRIREPPFWEGVEKYSQRWSPKNLEKSRHIFNFLNFSVMKSLLFSFLALSILLFLGCNTAGSSEVTPSQLACLSSEGKITFANHRIWNYAYFTIGNDSFRVEAGKSYAICETPGTYSIKKRVNGEGTFTETIKLVRGGDVIVLTP